MRLLDDRNPSGDWKRWSAAITERCRAAGEDFVLALEHHEEMDEPPAVPDVNSEEPYALTRPQRRQAAIRALVMNSLPPNDDPGTPRRLCRGLQHVGGYMNGQEQVWLVLRKRYEVSEADAEPADLLRDLLTMEWPTKVSEADYQTMVAKKVRLATELEMNPDGVDQAESRQLAMWWDMIASPPQLSLPCGGRKDAHHDRRRAEYDWRPRKLRRHHVHRNSPGRGGEAQGVASASSVLGYRWMRGLCGR